MKRDMELTRKILMEIADGTFDDESVDELTKYNYWLLCNGRYVNAFSPYGNCPAGALTDEGNEFLSALSDPNLFASVKAAIEHSVGAAPVQVWLTVLKRLIADRIVEAAQAELETI